MSYYRYIVNNYSLLSVRRLVNLKHFLQTTRCFHEALYIRVPGEALLVETAYVRVRPGSYFLYRRALFFFQHLFLKKRPVDLIPEHGVLRIILREGNDGVVNVVVLDPYPPLNSTSKRVWFSEAIAPPRTMKRTMDATWMDEKYTV